jgi:glycosyltransferase involved in cell wall biosynthesis
MIVPNGVTVQDPVAISQDDGFTIICLANYERRKGQKDLLQAVAALRNDVPVRIVLLGFESETGQRNELTELAKSLGLDGKVDIPGPVMGDAKWEHFRRATCFCLPSYDEGLPMAMLEAMGLGLPVVVTRVGAVPEAVADGKEGLIYDAGDVAALAHCLQTLIDDPERAQRIGAAGRERLICEFSLDRSAGLLRKIYDDL